MSSPDPVQEPRETRAQALEHLVDQEAGRLYSLGLRFCGNPEEARDLVQETFLQALRGWEGFEGRAKASTWLYTIAARVCQRFHRRRSGEPEHFEPLDEVLPLGDPALSVVPEEPLGEEQRAESKKLIEEEIARLPIDFRMPLVLKEIVGLPVADIAQVMDIPEATVKTRLHRARLKVRKALESTLPRRAVPPLAYSQAVCLDLLRAKQDTLDRGVPYEFPPGVLCERCGEFFATLDLTKDLCREIGAGELPPEVRRALSEALRQAG